MELSARRKITRDITGPTPHSVAVIARRKLKRHPEWLILDHRRKIEDRERSDAFIYDHQKVDLKSAWIQATDKKILSKTIQRRVDDLLQKNQFDLEERRERLRELLSSEESEYFAEIASKKETVLERQAKMRERARTLRERRESERLAFVEAKLDQKWRDQCEELRGIETKQQLAIITKDRSKQLSLKAEEQKRQEQEEAMYAKMWKEDCLSKCKREEMEEVLRIERSKEALELLNVQRAAKEAEKKNIEELRKKEAELLQEEAALRAIEDERMRQEKRQKQDQNRALLDYSHKLKMKKRAKEVQEELALDMKFLEQILAESTNEAQGQLQNKKQLKAEVALYRKHLQEQAEEEKRREKELEAVITVEVEKQWSRRLEQWRKEKEARNKLMQDVLDSRKKQIQEKLSEIEKEKAQHKVEGEKLKRIFEEHKQLEKQQEEERRQVVLSYQQDLIKQMEHHNLTKQIEKQQMEEELALCKEAEAAYQRKVQEAINKPNPSKLHPRRLSLSGH